jgi:hypothetical protein
MDLVVRFLVGGTIVSLFALIGDVLKPKGLAGVLALSPQWRLRPSRTANHITKVCSH